MIAAILGLVDAGDEVVIFEQFYKGQGRGGASDGPASAAPILEYLNAEA
jgi:hypothetical protein